MNPILKNVLAVIAGWFGGSVLNMSLVMLGTSVIPAVGYDTTNFETMAATAHVLEAKHFVFPFFAHALGTLLGAFIAAKIAATKAKAMALIVGAIFFLGGISAGLMMSAPILMMVIDLTLAYIPMAYLGWILAGKKA